MYTRGNAIKNLVGIFYSLVLKEVDPSLLLRTLLQSQVVRGRATNLLIHILLKL